jgi:hypothetical protein
MMQNMERLRYVPAAVVLFLIIFLSGDLLAQENDGGGETDAVRFAVIGDFGVGNEDEQAVADMVASWDVDFILSTGDNYYLQAGGKGGNGLNQYDNSVGQFYCPFLYETGQPSWGISNCPPEQQSAGGNRFFPVIGNHDRTDTGSGGITDYLNYFTLPGPGFDNSSDNERFYDFVQGPVHFFALDSDTAIVDSEDMAAQKAWLQEGLANSTTPWQVVYFHQGAYSSAKHGSEPLMQWPFSAWGADMVFQGHDHVYERIMTEEMVYFVSGNGGRRLYGFRSIVPGSAVRHNAGYGAMLVTATDSDVNFEAWSVAKSANERANSTPFLVDCFSLPTLQEECAGGTVPVPEVVDVSILDNENSATGMTGIALAIVVVLILAFLIVRRRRSA